MVRIVEAPRLEDDLEVLGEAGERDAELEDRHPSNVPRSPDHVERATLVLVELLTLILVPAVVAALVTLAMGRARLAGGGGWLHPVGAPRSIVVNLMGTVSEKPERERDVTSGVFP